MDVVMLKKGKELRRGQPDAHRFGPRLSRRWFQRVHRCANLCVRAIPVAMLTQAGRKALIHALPRHLDYVRTTVFNHLSDSDIEVIGRAFQPLVQRLDRSGRFACAAEPAEPCGIVTSDGVA